MIPLTLSCLYTKFKYTISIQKASIKWTDDDLHLNNGRCGSIHIKCGSLRGSFLFFCPVSYLDESVVDRLSERAAARIDYTSIIAKRDIFDEKRLMSKPLSLRSPDLAPLLAKFRELCTDTNFQVVKVAYLKSLPGGERQVLHTDTKEGCISALIPLNCQLNVRLYFLSIFMY